MSISQAVTIQIWCHLWWAIKVSGFTDKEFREDDDGVSVAEGKKEAQLLVVAFGTYVRLQSFLAPFPSHSCFDTWREVPEPNCYKC